MAALWRQAVAAVVSGGLAWYLLALLGAELGPAPRIGLFLVSFAPTYVGVLAALSGGAQVTRESLSLLRSSWPARP